MGKLIDQDYLWLQQEPPSPRRSSIRLALVVVVVLAVAAGAWYSLAVGGDSVESQPETIPQADNHREERASQARGAPAHARPTPAQREPAQAWPAVARSPATGLMPVKQIIGNDPSTALDEAIRSFTEQPDPDHDDSGGSAKAGAAAADWRTVDIRSGDTLSIAFGRHGLSYMDSLNIAHLPKYGAYFTRRLKDGARMRVRADDQGRVQALDYPLDALHTLEIRRDDQQFHGSIVLADVERRRTYATGVITTSFYVDALAAGLSDRQILQLHHIFSWDIDFGQDLHPGDRFVAVYDELYKDGQKVADGDLLAAAFINKGHEYRALRHTDTNGAAHYYTPSGRPMRKAFVRAPVDYTRVSSPFNLARSHPILHRIRRHEGTDYAAPMNTPIHATGDGRIIFQGRRGGYGNMVIIRHSADVTMRFGHMARFARGLQIGNRVKQGQVIGYVGMTGLATGPHVHYEFRVDGQPRNPQTVRLPGAAPLSGRQLAVFRQQTSPLLAQLDDMAHTQVAQVADTQVGSAD